MNWATTVLTKQIRHYLKAAQTARYLDEGCWVNELDFVSPLIPSTGKVCHCCLRKRKRGWGWRRKKRGNAAQSPSLNSSGRRVANEEMRRRGKITKTNVCPGSIWKPDTQCVGKNPLRSRCRLWWLCGSVRPSLSPNHKPFLLLCNSSKTHNLKYERRFLAKPTNIIFPTYCLMKRILDYIITELLDCEGTWERSVTEKRDNGQMWISILTPTHELNKHIS